jgi:hypothetical protein
MRNLFSHHCVTSHLSTSQLYEDMAFLTNLRQRLQYSTERHSTQPILSNEEPEVSSTTPKHIPSDDEQYSPADPHDAAIPRDAQAGELTLDETAAGGLGRHLGLFSTTFLV